MRHDVIDFKAQWSGGGDILPLKSHLDAKPSILQLHWATGTPGRGKACWAEASSVARIKMSVLDISVCNRYLMTGTKVQMSIARHASTLSVSFELSYEKGSWQMQSRNIEDIGPVAITWHRDTDITIMLSYLAGVEVPAQVRLHRGPLHWKRDDILSDKDLLCKQYAL